MKVCTKKTAPKFNPIELTISIESEQELDLLKSLFCYDKSIPEKKIILMFDKNQNLIKEFDSLTSAGVFLGKHAAQIQQYASGKRNHKKYIFKYKNNNLC